MRVVKVETVPGQRAVQFKHRHDQKIRRCTQETSSTAQIAVPEHATENYSNSIDALSWVRE